MVRFLDLDALPDAEAIPETDPELDLFFDSLVWEESDSARIHVVLSREAPDASAPGT
jgi:hypothetical protein